MFCPLLNKSLAPLTIFEAPAQALQVPVVNIEHYPLHDEASEKSCLKEKLRIILLSHWPLKELLKEPLKE